jgi:5-methylcytosine-specific restriction endonuclease McrA
MSSYTKGLCACGNLQESKGINYLGKRTYSKYCSTCKRGKIQKNNLLKIDKSCQKCGFKPEHPSQMDIDHIDGNHRNNSDDNLQVLCANCHRLKTHINKEWKS